VALGVASLVTSVGKKVGRTNGCVRSVSEDVPRHYGRPSEIARSALDIPHTRRGAYRGWAARRSFRAKSTTGGLVAALVMVVGSGFPTVITAAITSAFVEPARRRLEGTRTDTLSAKLDQIGTRLDVIEARLKNMGEQHAMHRNDRGPIRRARAKAWLSWPTPWHGG
jgi:hypothetical protein